MTVETLALVVVALIGIAVGVGLSLLWPRKAPAEHDDQLAEARAARDERLRVAREQALEERVAAQASARQALAGIEETEHRLARREERLESRLDAAAAREATADARDAALAERAAKLRTDREEQLATLERIRSLPTDVARATLLEEVAPSVSEVTAERAEGVLAEAEDACREARARPTALSIQRASGDVVGEFALVPVQIPREEVKGRIIGREGRNIKAFEAMTGVELVIEDAPDVVTLSGFDPFRREVARLALLDLIEDGRIHPGRIEETVRATREMLSRQLREDGMRAAEAAGAGPVSADMAELLGRLRLLRGAREDSLTEAIRHSGLASSLAEELKADVRTARRAALFYDLGRAIGREAGGSIETITADVLTRAGEPAGVVAAVRRPGDLYPAVTPEQAAVWLARAAGELGPAARDESPIRRAEAIERVVQLVDGVAEALAFQLGARVRLLIRPVDDLDASGRALLARAVLERIDASLGPRVGMTVAMLTASIQGRGAGEDRSGGNGAARIGAGRPPFRGRHRPR